jgi:hypothetical protein
VPLKFWNIGDSGIVKAQIREKQIDHLLSQQELAGIARQYGERFSIKTSLTDPSRNHTNYDGSSSYSAL